MILGTINQPCLRIQWGGCLAFSVSGGCALRGTYYDTHNFSLCNILKQDKTLLLCTVSSVHFLYTVPKLQKLCEIVYVLYINGISLVSSVGHVSCVSARDVIVKEHATSGDLE